MLFILIKFLEDAVCGKVSRTTCRLPGEFRLEKCCCDVIQDIRNSREGAFQYVRRKIIICTLSDIKELVRRFIGVRNN